jgi:hypothetical protein
MRSILFAITMALATLAGCSSDSGTDAGLDGPPADYPKIEGPTTNPIVDMPLSPDTTSAPDAGVSTG